MVLIYFFFVMLQGKSLSLHFPLQKELIDTKICVFYGHDVVNQTHSLSSLNILGLKCLKIKFMTKTYNIKK
jgi:hypothetical protein